MIVFSFQFTDNFLFNSIYIFEFLFDLRSMILLPNFRNTDNWHGRRPIKYYEQCPPSPPTALFSGIFHRFFRNFRKFSEVATD